MSDAKIGAAGLIRLTTVTACVVGFLLAVVPAGAYFAVNHTQIKSALDAEANINARLISQFVSKSPLNWEEHRGDLVDLLTQRPADETPEIRRILDTSGNVILTVADNLGNWQVSINAPVIHSGKTVGSFEVTRSMSGIFANTVGIFLVSLWFATWSYLILRILPDRALKNALQEASSSKELAYEAMRDRDKAEEAARLRSVFLANMSHELRTPMNGVLGMLDLVSDTELDPEQKEYVDLAYSSGKHLLIIINDILDFSKIDEGHLTIVPAAFNLPELLQHTVEMFNEEAVKKGLRLERSFALSLPEMVVTDPVRVRQILINLLGNAVKFTAEGSIRLIAVHKIENNKNYIDIMLEDTGSGIPQDKLEYIFKPFTQADESSTRRHGGTGLGLAISRQLAEALGGSLTAHSETDKGSIFHLRIAVEIPG